MDYSNLMKEALNARERAYAPYSRFKVGAALLTKSGKIYKGCNIENAAYTPSNCAERTAVFSAIAAGDRDFAAIAIVGFNEDGSNLHKCAPCGVCRQVLREFVSDDFPIVVGTSPEDFECLTLKDFLPYSFGPEDL